MSRDVVVTGIGIVCPAGTSRENAWKSLLANSRAVQCLDQDLLPGQPVRCAATVPAFIPPADTHHLPRVSQFAIAAAAEALEQARLLQPDANNPTSIPLAVSIGTSKPLHPYQPSGAADTSFSFAEMDPAAVARAVACRFHLNQALHTSVSACATATQAIIRAIQFIEDGDAHAVLAGGADTPVQPLWLAAYEQMGLLASPHPDLGPAWACRPFDQNRKGFALGEGAAIFVLETRESASRRGVSPIARFPGYASGSDPAGLTSLSIHGHHLSRVICAACRRASLPPLELAAVHAHGTGTHDNDLTESHALQTLLGCKLSRLPIVSTKGAIGHLMGAAGAVETALAVLACRDRQLPGNVTLLHPDRLIGDLCLPRSRSELRAGPILKLSMGFGGHLAALVIDRP